MDDSRASDADREQTAEQIREAAGDGRLTVDELDDRLNAVYAASTRRELVALSQDVAGPGPRPVVAGEGGSGWIVSVMSGSGRTGRWRVARRCRVINFMGGSDLDFERAELAADTVEVRVYSLMGGSEIRVPEHLNVEVSEFAFMGGNVIRLGDEERPDSGGPLLRLRLVSIMGGSSVKRRTGTTSP